MDHDQEFMEMARKDGLRIRLQEVEEDVEHRLDGGVALLDPHSELAVGFQWP